MIIIDVDAASIMKDYNITQFIFRTQFMKWYK